MIPKRLIFIWLGSEVPEYGKFCMKTFHEVNPDFEIMFIHEPDMNNIQNQDLKDLLKILNSKEKTVYSYMFDRKFAQQNLQSDIGKITCLSDAFRLYLLNKYGGIYLDLDTFPVKKFDDKLLNNENGFIINHHKKHCDFFFMGFVSNYIEAGLLAFYPDKSSKLFDEKILRIKYLETFRIIFDKKLLEYSQKFYDNKLIFGESVLPINCIENYYIDHFRRGSWKNESI